MFKLFLAGLSARQEENSSWFRIWDSGWSCVVLKITIPLISVLNSVSWGDVVLKKELTLLKMIISASLTF